MVRIKELPPLDKEVDDHISFRKDRAKFFVGRTKVLSLIDDYIKGSDPHPLAIYREPGSGKSALLAKAIEKARQNRTGAEVLFRFVGATPASSDIRALLESLCRQVSRQYEAEESHIPAEYKELAEDLPMRLALAKEGSPLLLFIDALDQLGDAHNARSLTWLPADLPPHVRFVVSTLPGECQAALEKKLPAGSLVRLEKMGAGEGEELLDLWLKDGGRALQKDQREDILGKFRLNGLPLYLKLAFEEARTFHAPPEKRLPIVIWSRLYFDIEPYLAVSTTGRGEGARKIYGGVYELMEDYRRALEAFPSSAP